MQTDIRQYNNETVPLRPVWAEVDRNALRENFRAIRSRVKDAPVAASVKADAYGHGAVSCAEILSEEGADRLLVATVPEGLELRAAGIRTPILLLGLCPAESFPVAVKAGITLPIASLSQAKALATLSRADGDLPEYAGVHDATGAADLSRGDRELPGYFLVLDSGMGRIGLPISSFDAEGKPSPAKNLMREESFREACEILSLKGIRCLGVFTHLAKADVPTPEGKRYTEDQIRAFYSFLDELHAAGLETGQTSIANSGAVLNYPETYTGRSGETFLCRPGIILYGYHPTGKGAVSPIPLKPVLSVRARLAQVRTVPAGTGIGYGSTFVSEKETVVGTVPVGYADGYPRLLSNRGFVLVGGKKAPIIGKICMDQFMIDLSGLDAKEGDVVTLLGKDGENQITADDLADLAGTISYEILCSLSRRIQPVYL